jgi:hypothetical protein
MINIFSHTFHCRCVLLEYAEGQQIEDFDLSIPLTKPLFDDVVSERYPELVAKLTKLSEKDYLSGLMIDHFLNEENQPAVISFGEPEEFFKEWGVTGVLDETKKFYAVVIYTGRDNLVRTIYRNPENPQFKTDVHNADGSFSHHEEIVTGDLPDNLKWAETRLQELKDLGINARINHFKNNGENSKVYFAVEATFN